jgi:hypothetical protein
MTTPTNPIELFTPFLPATYNVPEEEDRLRTFLVDKLSMISDLVNDKRIGTFIQAMESLNGEKWFYAVTGVTRNGYQAIAYIPSLPATGVLILTLTSMPAFPVSNINPTFVITQTWGTASKPPTATGAGNADFFTYLNQGDSRISYTMSDTVITITTTVDLSAYSGFIVVQYLRDGI